MTDFTYTHNFRTVTAKTSPYYGKKRQPVSMNYSLPDDLDSDTTTVLRFAIETLAARKLQENGENWDYQPSLEELSIPSLAGYLTETRERAARVWTKANIESLFLELRPVFLAAKKPDAFWITVKALATVDFLPLIGESKKVSSLLSFLSENQEILAWLETCESEISLSVFAEMISRLEKILESERQELNLDNLL